MTADNTAARRTEPPTFSDRVALVTGASDGIGAATARILARRGAAVAVNYHQSEAKAKELVDAITADGGRAVAIQADVTDEEQVGTLVEQTVARLGPIDVLVLNATGLYGHDVPFVPFAHTGWDFVERTLLRQIKSLFHPLKAVLPGMVARQHGAVVAVGAALSRFPAPGLLAISMAKSALETAVKTLAREYGPSGIRVNGVAPGFILSAATEAAPEELRIATAERAPLRRNGLPVDVAEAVVFLASDQAGYLTGTYVLADGGTNML